MSFSQIMMAAAFAAGFASGLGLSALYDRVWDDPAVRRAGVAAGEQAERLAWQEARNRAELVQMQRLAAMQAKIDAADRTIADWQINDRRRVESFRAILEEQKREDLEKRTDRSACDLPDRVWDGLR